VFIVSAIVQSKSFIVKFLHQVFNAAGGRTQAGNAADHWRINKMLRLSNISQGSVGTHLRCDGIFSDNIITNFLLILKVKIIPKIG